MLTLIVSKLRNDSAWKLFPDCQNLTSNLEALPLPHNKNASTGASIRPTAALGSEAEALLNQTLLVRTHSQLEPYECSPRTYVNRALIRGFLAGNRCIALCGPS